MRPRDFVRVIEPSELLFPVYDGNGHVPIPRQHRKHGAAQPPGNGNGLEISKLEEAAAGAGLRNYSAHRLHKDQRLNSNSKLAAGVLAGILIGVTVARTLHAEHTKMPLAYLIAEVERDPGKPTDPAAAKRYAEEAPKSIVPFSGRYVVRGGTIETLEGEAPRGYIVVMAFDNVEKARGWYHSPEYEALKPLAAAQLPPCLAG